jgi:hypothetical protein
MKRFGVVKVLLAVMCGILIFAFAGPIGIKDASAQTASTSLRVAGSVFHPIDSTTAYSSPGGGSIYATGTPGLFSTPLYLPQGSNIAWARMYYLDNDATNNCVGWLTVYDLYGNIANIGGVDQEWSVTSADTGNSYDDTPIINHKVDYTQYSYVLNWYPQAASSDIQLCGFRVFYTPPASKTVVIPLQ